MDLCRINPVPALSLGILCACLFGNALATSKLSLINRLFFEIRDFAISDATVQLGMFLLAVGYFFVLLSVESRWTGVRFLSVCIVNRWLFALVGISFVSYLLQYAENVSSADALPFVTAVVCGKGIAVLGLRRQRTHYYHIAIFMIAALVVVFSLKVSTITSFQYSGQTRWSGVWESPNICGALVASALLFCLGSMILIWRAGSELRWLLLVALGICGGALMTGLLETYSRGAYLSFLVGVATLIWCLFPASCDTSWGYVRRNVWVLTFIAAATAIIILFDSRLQISPAIRRVFSVVNINDFSWRNRVIAWEGALQMIDATPLFGFGWDRPLKIFQHFYGQGRMVEITSVQINDCFLLTARLGMPSMVCFISCLWSSLIFTRSVDEVSPGTNRTPLEHFIWSSVALTLAVSFWFNCGLCTVALGTLFWTALESGRCVTTPSITENTVA